MYLSSSNIKHFSFPKSSDTPEPLGELKIVVDNQFSNVTFPLQSGLINCCFYFSQFPAVLKCVASAWNWLSVDQVDRNITNTQWYAHNRLHDTCYSQNLTGTYQWTTALMNVTLQPCQLYPHLIVQLYKYFKYNCLTLTRELWHAVQMVQD